MVMSDSCRANCGTCKCSMRLKRSSDLENDLKINPVFVTSERDFPAAAGDRLPQWQCETICNQSSDSKRHPSDICTGDNLVCAIDGILQKIELINKIKLPKLNNDLLHVKFIAERIAKQNDNILRKISEMERATQCLESEHSKKSGYRMRSVSLTPKPRDKSREDDNVPMIPPCEKRVCYRTRRSYILRKMLHLLNKKLKESSRNARKRR